MFVTGNHFQPSLMYEGNDGAYPNEAHFWCSTIRYALGLTHINPTRLERLDGDEHSSLIKTFVNYGRKKL